jgi:hypothetical protein
MPRQHPFSNRGRIEKKRELLSNLQSSPHLSLGLLPIPIMSLVRLIDLQTNLDTRLSLCYPSFPLSTVNIRRLHLLLITQHLSSSFARLSLFARCVYKLCGVIPAAVLLWLSPGPSQTTICWSEPKEAARRTPREAPVVLLMR